MTRAHLAEVVGLLGPPPLDLLERGVRSPEFFSEDGKLPDTAKVRAELTDVFVGQWIADVPIPQGNSLDKAEQFLTGKNKAMLLDFMRGMLARRPEDRKTVAELLKDPWLTTWEISD
jgi:hypothetical protein